MPEIADLLPNNPAIETYRDGPTRAEARCVLLWVQRTKRATANRAANLAVSLADKLGLPVAAVFCLVPGYPRATLRAYHFMAEGLRELPDAFNARGIGWALRIGDAPAEVAAAAEEFGAACVVTDQDTVRWGRQWREELARRIPVPLVAVDSDTVAPTSLFPAEEYAAHTLRPKLWRAIRQGDWLRDIPDIEPVVRNDLSRLRLGPDPVAALDGFDLDRSVGPAPRFVGGPREARARLDRFVRARLVEYDDGRNQPEREVQSELSPYLHFGFVGPVQVARAAIAARGLAGRWLAPTRTLKPGELEAHTPDGPLDSFLDELVTQRELAVNFALRNPAYDRWDALPDWGRRTLRDHADDPRPVIYTPGQIEAGETGDRLWNAAQKQMRHDGYMPNYLRMYWAKQLLLWTPSPEEAFALCAEMNDRWLLDGRDPNGYSGIAWSIGGKHDRPFPPNKPIFGLVRPMTPGGMARKFDVEAYVRLVETRTGETVAPPPAKAAQRRLAAR